MLQSEVLWFLFPLPIGMSSKTIFRSRSGPRRPSCSVARISIRPSPDSAGCSCNVWLHATTRRAIQVPCPSTSASTSRKETDQARRCRRHGTRPVYEIDGKSYCLRVNAGCPLALPSSSLQDITPLYRLREQILNDLVYHVHTHGARPGMISFGKK